ncbi:redoxin domain-containing protein [Costertonia aggregata]|uniref:Redoxin domain-containing protein n=1 Tax=Costertonia aggregata TaxID=343403 RepID=A0A7H9ANI7_9FLAO|nr:redoxin domain-containing protein [Costertonia aggregata]QLG45021.1 redoxin domain-containing protein [Costertonia aggregata]
MAEVTTGQKAPDFKLVGTDLEPIQLSDYKGKNLILHFFPLAFTSVCTEQLCTANGEENDYASLNAEVAGVSVDSPFVLDKFAKENNLNFKLGSDFNRTVSKDYGVLFDGDFAGMTGFSMRSAFVIDGEGIIRYSETTDGKTLPSFENIKKTLQEIN